jgi:hypothetical protein
MQKLHKFDNLILEWLRDFEDEKETPIMLLNQAYLEKKKEKECYNSFLKFLSKKNVPNFFADIDKKKKNFYSRFISYIAERIILYAYLHPSKQDIHVYTYFNHTKRKRKIPFLWTNTIRERLGQSEKYNLMIFEISAQVPLIDLSKKGNYAPDVLLPANLTFKITGKEKDNLSSEIYVKIDKPQKIPKLSNHSEFEKYIVHKL